MGEVWVARDEPTSELVAIKILRESTLGQRDAVTRFLREARIAAKIESPYAVRILHSGELPDGRGPYLVMELLEGSDLAGVIRSEGRVSLDRAVTFVLQVCHAVSRAHAAGVVHRDLKPSNLFLVGGGTADERVVVLDFGISKLAEDDGSLTGTGDALGTPRYMPPEQIRSSRSADARADVWALGVILFELLTGDLPFVGESGAAFIAAALADTPRAARDLQPDVPVEVERAIDRCLRKDPAERFQSVTELALALAPSAPPRAKELLEDIDRAVRGPRPLGGTQPLSGIADLAKAMVEAETIRLEREADVGPALTGAEKNEGTTRSIELPARELEPASASAPASARPNGGVGRLALIALAGLVAAGVVVAVVRAASSVPSAPSSRAPTTAAEPASSPLPASSPSPPSPPSAAPSAPAGASAAPSSALAGPSPSAAASSSTSPPASSSSPPQAPAASPPGTGARSAAPARPRPPSAKSPDPSIDMPLQ